MTKSQILGVALAVVGVLLLAVTYQASNAPLDQVSSAVTGRVTNQTMLYGVLGVAATVGGLLLAFFRRPAQRDG